MLEFKNILAGAVLAASGLGLSMAKAQDTKNFDASYVPKTPPAASPPPLPTLPMIRTLIRPSVSF